MQLLPKNKNLGWTPFAWLVYLISLVPYLAFDPNFVALVTAGGVVGVFLFFYFRAYWVEGRKRFNALLAIGLLGLVYIPINPGASTFLVYCGALFGLFFSQRATILAVSFLLIGLGLESWFFELPLYSWFPAVIFTPLIAAINVHFGERDRQNVRLSLAQDEVERLAKLDERERIARDLHDLLGHTLSVVTLKSELVGRLLPQTWPSGDLDQLRNEIKDIEALSRRAMNEVRNSVRGYRAHRMQTEIAKARMALAAAQIHFNLETGPYDLTSEEETVVAHALREAVTNVVRHARALQCTVRLLTQANGTFLLEVVDDGRGIRGDAGTGLQGMKERVFQVGGKLTISDASPNRPLTRGTLLRLTIPRNAATETLDTRAAAAS